MSTLAQGFSSDEELQKAQRDLVDATEAATCSGPSTGVSAFASPGIQKGDASDVSQAKDLLGKVNFQPAVHPACIFVLSFTGYWCQLSESFAHVSGAAPPEASNEQSYIREATQALLWHQLVTASDVAMSQEARSLYLRAAGRPLYGAGKAGGGRGCRVPRAAAERAAAGAAAADAGMGVAVLTVRIPVAKPTGVPGTVQGPLGRRSTILSFCTVQTSACSYRSSGHLQGS